MCVCMYIQAFITSVEHNGYGRCGDVQTVCACVCVCVCVCVCACMCVCVCVCVCVCMSGVCVCMVWVCSKIRMWA